MPFPITINVSASAFGQQYTDDQSTTSDMGIPHAPSVPAAKVGSLTTRTDNDTGVLTMDTGHGITTAAKLDVYWQNADLTYGSRSNMTVGTVATNSVPIDGGTGDNLPVNLTAITAAVPHVENATVDGDNLTAILFRSNDSQAIFTVCEDDGTTVLLTIRLAANSSYIWNDQSGITNPLAATDVGTIRSSHASTVAETMYAALAYN